MWYTITSDLLRFYNHFGLSSNLKFLVWFSKKIIYVGGCNRFFNPSTGYPYPQIPQKQTIPQGKGKYPARCLAKVGEVAGLAFEAIGWIPLPDPTQKGRGMIAWFGSGCKVKKIKIHHCPNFWRRIGEDFVFSVYNYMLHPQVRAK
jgi:hypothetical protein